MEKCFNVTATCVPSKHYMVDISGKIDRIEEELIEKDYPKWKEKSLQMW